MIRINMVAIDSLYVEVIVIKDNWLYTFQQFRDTSRSLKIVDS